jgi:hypothetical protein
LFDIVELFAPSDGYAVLIHDGIRPSILLFAIVNAVNHVSADQDDGISPLRLLLLSLSVVSLVRADHEDGRAPVRLVLFTSNVINQVLLRIQDGIDPVASPVLLERLSVVSFVKVHPVGIEPVN